jgi:hypothetical protein
MIHTDISITSKSEREKCNLFYIHKNHDDEENKSNGLKGNKNNFFDIKARCTLAIELIKKVSLLGTTAICDFGP